MKRARPQTIEAEVVEDEPAQVRSGGSEVASVPAEAAARRGARTLGGIFTALTSLLLGGLYILNPTGGIIEFLPDNLPIVGNLDEAGATLVVWYALRYLFSGRGRPRP